MALDAFAQVDRHRLPPRDGEDGLFLDFALQRVDRGIHGDDALAQLDVALDQRLHGIGDLPLRQPAHLGDLAGDFLQVGVERLGGVVDSRGGDFGHWLLPGPFIGDYPNRPVM